LIGLGVTSIGHRRKLLAAIGQLKARVHPFSEDASIDDPRLTSRAKPVAESGAAERRQLSVMFCDLVGSTALASRFDQEDLREVIGAYHRCVASTVARFDGFVAKYMGDGVLIYFGYPLAHEDDAERAVRAALAVIETVGRLDLPERSIGAHRYCQRTRGGRRPYRRRRSTGTRHRRRDPEPGGSAARAG
jgi:class 3 adenylate cyclase